MTDFSPEEKLLNLIKNKESAPKEAVRAKTEESQKGADSKPRSEVAWDDLSEPFDFLDIKAYSCNYLHHILIGTALGFFLYAIFTFGKYCVLETQFQPLLKGKSGGRLSREEAFSFPPVSHYAVIGEKKLFKLQEKPKTKAMPTAPREEITIQKKLKLIDLVGIIWDEGRPQAIIEDKKSKDTYYLFQGDEVAGLSIEKIEPGKVIFRYEDERAELTI